MATSASDIKAGGAYVELFATSDKMDRALAEAERKVDKWVEKINSDLRSMLRAGVVMSAPLIAGIKMAADYEQSMARLGTVLKPDMMRFAPVLRAQLKDLAAETGRSLGDLAEAFINVNRRTNDQVLAFNLLRSAAQLAVTTGEDVRATTDFLTTAINSMNLGMSESAHVAGIAQLMWARGGRSLGELAHALPLASGLARESGLSFEELAAAVTTMSRVNLDAGIITTGLQMAMRGLVKPSKDVREGMAALGVQLDTAMLSTKGLYGIIEGLSEKDVSALSRLFDQRALRVILALRGDMKGWARDMELMKNPVGALKRAFVDMSTTTAFQWSRVWQSIKIVSVEIGEALLPFMNKLLVRILEIVPAVRRWVAEQAELIFGLAVLTASLIAAGVAARGLVTALGLLKSPILWVAALAGSFLLVSDAIGLTNSGFLKFVENIRVRGFKIITWLRAIAEEFDVMTALSFREQEILTKTGTPTMKAPMITPLGGKEMPAMSYYQERREVLRRQEDWLKVQIAMLRHEQSLMTSAIARSGMGRVITIFEERLRTVTEEMPMVQKNIDDIFMQFFNKTEAQLRAAPAEREAEAQKIFQKEADEMAAEQVARGKERVKLQDAIDASMKATVVQAAGPAVGASLAAAATRAAVGTFSARHAANIVGTAFDKDMLAAQKNLGAEVAAFHKAFVDAAQNRTIPLTLVR